MNKETLLNLLLIIGAVIAAYLFGIITECNRSKEKDIQIKTDEVALTAADSSKEKPVLSLNENAVKSATKPIYKKVAVEVAKSTKKHKVESVMIAERTIRDTVKVIIPKNTLYIDTTIYKPFSEFYIRTVRTDNGDSLVVGSTIQSSLHAVWKSNKYDDHKTWVGRLFHKDKTMQTVTLTDENPNIVLENSVFSNISDE